MIAKSRDWIAVSKPRGLAVHGGQGVKANLLTILRKQENEKEIELVHRLDKETSGLVILARQKASLGRVETMLSGAKKGYAVICRGKFRKKNFICNDELIVDGKKKKAKTHFKVLAHFGEHALLKCTLLSGRKHQLRRHCLTLGHPILGDDKYGDFEYNKKYRAKLGQLPLVLTRLRP